MADAPRPGTGRHLAFMSPLSGERADRLAADLARRRPGTVLDLGCGWGELLLRILALAPGARGTGVDEHEHDVTRGRANAAERGLAERATFVHGPAKEHLSSADVVISVGAYHALGSITEALRELRALLHPGGRLLFAAEFWEQPPTAARLALMWPGMTADDCTDLAGLVDAAIAAGFRPLRIETATRGEWEEFESGLAADREEWLIGNPDHPEAAEIRAALDSQRSIWLRGHRDLMGFAYLTLG
ncbi:SAM-dependent methyltransferase [Allocatelliglobosispora scoriae]|uniref:SAM-dependent methyltransferase n=1 Tax=Allocatelliglobosispora scoriae TaxID=643052 RepID=A0A841BND1_9ACTN|nr:class I SAM-dependent methyltransferase [Allocatelliglobosispora scoriae]MBB5868252.1 SAM-dependent methyltransferase [Allocatelliglobosispora scoriae]